MATFTEIIETINRMPAEKAAVMLARMPEEPEQVEREVMDWGRAHPKPRYPTWAEWLCEMGVSRVSSYEDGKMVYSRTRKFYEEMDEATAKALGIKPMAMPEKKEQV